MLNMVLELRTDCAWRRIGCDGGARDSARVSIQKGSVPAKACSREGQVNSGGNTKRLALVLGKGRELFCNPKTMGYAHGSKKAEADE